MKKDAILEFLNVDEDPQTAQFNIPKGDFHHR